MKNFNIIAWAVFAILAVNTVYNLTWSIDTLATYSLVYLTYQVNPIFIIALKTAILLLTFGAYLFTYFKVFKPNIDKGTFPKSSFIVSIISFPISVLISKVLSFGGSVLFIQHLSHELYAELIQISSGFSVAVTFFNIIFWTIIGILLVTKTNHFTEIQEE